MSEVGSNEEWEEWLADVDDPDECFKWGWNLENGTTVWTVGGPGDGLPSHGERLNAAWGRAPSIEQGDVLGAAYRYADGVSDDEGVRDLIVVDAYYGSPVPAAVVDWFKATFPEALLRPRSP